MNIELQRVSKSFGSVQANQNISLRFESGRIYGVLGENGAGKSTLMKTLAGYQRADSGEIRFDGRVVDYRTPLAALREGVGMLQQDPLDVAAFSVLDNFVFGPLTARGVTGSAAAAELRRLSARFGFDLDPAMPTAQLSIGGRQQLEIVRLLALGVRALILDEPTTGISAQQKQTLFDALKQLAREDGMTVLLVSHKLEDVLALCDEVAVLRAGRLVGTRSLPATTDELVNLMFGQELAAENRTRVNLTGAPPLLQVSEVSLRTRRLSVEGLTVSLRRGEVLGLAGLEGSGQELLLRACAGLLRPSGGQLFINETELTGASYRGFKAAGVAFAAAGRLEEGLVAGLTLAEHVALMMKPTPLIPWAQAHEHTQQLIKRYNVRGRPDSRIEELSGGNQQRVLMGLMPESPSLLVLEQPTRGLDVDSARWIWHQLMARRDSGAAVLFSSPDLDELVTYSDRILVFYAGRTAELTVGGSPSAMLERLGRFIGGQFEELAS
ncbi:MAG: ATP-binding cassette domain-containing protein [Chloroflexota bacterium]|nr:ATP-binding cassette domain-containing protein [Chloroflexota bacterium]